jgi:hypothetical protein
VDKITLLLTVIQDNLHAISGTGKLTRNDGKVPIEKGKAWIVLQAAPRLANIIEGATGRKIKGCSSFKLQKR